MHLRSDHLGVLLGDLEEAQRGPIRCPGALLPGPDRLDAHVQGFGEDALREGQQATDGPDAVAVVYGWNIYACSARARLHDPRARRQLTALVGDGFLKTLDEQLAEALLLRHR